MRKLFNPAAWGRALSRPLVLAGLAVDLFPIIGVIVFGWSAAPLVMLYWMENLIAGVMTLPRIFLSGASFGAIGLLLSLFFCAFFIIHYGLFCAVHGSFLMMFISLSEGSIDGQLSSLMDVPAMVAFGLTSAQHVDWFVYSIIAFQALVLIFEFLIKKEWLNTNPLAEMFAPYSRILVLHFAIFAGAGALFVLGQPIVGVLALILFRSVYGVVTNGSGEFGFESGFTRALEEVSTRIGFEKAILGKSAGSSEEADDVSTPR